MGFFLPSQFTVGGQFGDIDIVVSGPGGIQTGGGVVYVPGQTLPPGSPGTVGAVPSWIWVVLIGLVAYAVISK